MSHTQTPLPTPLDRAGPAPGLSPERPGRLHRAVGVAVGAGLVVAGVLVASSLGLDPVLRIAGAVSLLLVGFGAAALGAAAIVVRRRLGELRHLPDLGRRFVTSHERAAVRSVCVDAAGHLTIEVASSSCQTMVFDESGAPDHVVAGAGGMTRRIVPAGSVDTARAFQALSALSARGTTVTLVSEGVVGLAGHVPTGWRLEAEGQLVITGRV